MERCASPTRVFPTRYRLCVLMGRALQFMIPWARFGKCRPEAYDDEIGERLWKWLGDEVKSHQG